MWNDISTDGSDVMFHSLPFLISNFVNTSRQNAHEPKLFEVLSG